MKAKTKRRLNHLITKKKLVKKHTSRHVLRTSLTSIAIACMAVLAYSIVLNKPVVTLAIHTSGPGGIEIQALTPTPLPANPLNGPPAMTGRASWYALGLPAPDALTCASRTYPRGTFIHVTNLRNGRAVICRVNDYGPEAWTNRIIDLSRGSFSQVDSLSTGTVPVELRIVNSSSGVRLPNVPSFDQLVGYSACRASHTPKDCDARRFDLSL